MCCITDVGHECSDGEKISYIIDNHGLCFLNMQTHARSWYVFVLVLQKTKQTFYGFSTSHIAISYSFPMLVGISVSRQS